MKNRLISAIVAVNANLNAKSLKNYDEKRLTKELKLELIDLTADDFKKLNLSSEVLETIKAIGFKMPKIILTADERKAAKDAKAAKKAAEKKITRMQALFCVIDKLVEKPDTVENMAKNVTETYLSDKPEKGKAKSDWFGYFVATNVESLTHYGVLTYDEKTKLYSKAK